MEKGDYIYLSPVKLKDVNDFCDRNKWQPEWNTLAEYNSLQGFYKANSILNTKMFSLSKIPGNKKAKDIPSDYIVADLKLPDNLPNLFRMSKSQVFVNLNIDEKSLEGLIHKKGFKYHLIINPSS